MASKIQVRRDTLSNWNANNPVLSSGEIAFITDENKFKVGDGATAFSSLPYLQADAYLDSVILGTDTTGNYVETMVPGDGIILSGQGSESASVTVTNTGVLSVSGTANEVEVSASTGNITLSLPETINANTTGTAASLASAKTIALSGDISGSASFDGTASVSINATIQPDSVALGTDTTGNYVSSASAGTGISVSGSGSEGSNVTISNTGVTSLTGTASQVSVSASNGESTISLPSSVIFPGTVTLNADPTQSLQAATKQYVDSVAEGLHVHASVETSTTADINLNDAPESIDGVTLTNGMRVLVKNQSNASQNGIYTYIASVDALVRATDYDSSGEVQSGDFVFVSGGDAHENTGWVQTNNVSTLGTDPISWSQFSGAGTYTAGTGLLLDGTIFSNTGVLSLAGTANEVEVSASSGNITVSLPTTINANTSGNADTATKLSNSRAIALGGDLSGSASFDGSASVSINATIQPNSVALGTDTTGNYIATVGGTDGVSISGSGSETSAVTIANTDKGSSQNIFKNVAVSGQSDIVADSNNDTLTVAGGTGINLTTNATTDTLTVTNSGVTSMSGTANEVEVSASTGSITVGLPNTINADTTGNSATATALQTARTINLGGDLSGSASFNGTSDITITATVDSQSSVNSITGTSNEITVSASVGDITLSLPETINANTTGSAAKLTTSRAITLTGDVTGTADFDGSASAGISSTLANSGVSAGTYGSASAVPIVTVDVKGRTTSASATPIAIAQSAVTNLATDLSAKAPLASPTLTGTPSAPTATVDTNTTQIATTSYVVGQGYLKSSSASSTYQPLDADLTSIAGLSGTSGLLRKTAENTFALDTSTFVNSLSGTENEIEVSASTGGVTLSLPNTINSNTTGTAARLTTARTIALSGDVSGSVTFDGSASANITTTIQPNSVTLGTDTTGNYVASASGGTGISVSGSGSENSAITITNTGVTSLSGTASQISVSASNGDATLSLPSAITFPGTVTLNSAPTQSLHAATKQYVDEVAEGLKTKPSVEVATTANLTSTYSNGTSGVGATLTANSNGAFPEIDGVTITSTTPGLNGVLVKNQTNPAHNGRYNLTQVGNGSTPWILTRCGLCDQSSEIPGMYVFVKDGTVGAGTGWVAVVDDPSTFIVGTDDIDYFQFSGAGTYTAGSGLALNGTEFSNTGVLSLSGTTNEVEVSASSGSVTISLPTTINANTTGSAATLTTSRTIELTGDVTGSATFNGGANASISATIAANSVALGTDTTGNYVATVTGTANQISVSGSGSENSAVTLSLPSTINVNTSGNAATSTKLATARAITLTGDVTGTANFDGSASAGIAATLANSGVSAGTYRSLTVNEKGLVTGGTNPTTLSGYGITDALSNSSTSTQSGYFGNIFLYDDSTPSHYLGITNSANLTAARTLSLNVNNADRSVSLSGDLTVSSAATVSGTNTGDQTITLTGDITGTGTGSFATTLANTAVTPASYGSASAVPTFTVDSKGRLTAASNTTIAIAQSAVTNLTTDLAAKAPLISPTFTTPNIGVATGTSFNSITGLSSTNPTMNGSVAVGTGTTVARADHVHPTDTSRAPLASPTFTGTVTAGTISITTADTATTASHYVVETASDGIIRPKTLANVRTEIVTTAAVNSAAATTVGTVTSGTWAATDVALAHGGTNASLTASNGAVVYSTASAMALTSVGTAGQVLTSNGAGAPTWQAAASSGFDGFFLSGM